MDGLAVRNGGDLVGAEFATLHAVNRCYAPSADDGAVEADLVVDPAAARAATVLRTDEDTRPVSGDRRLAVWIRGGDALAPTNVRPTTTGFFVGDVGSASSSTDDDAREGRAIVPRGDSDSNDDAPVTAVCVVGLVHANPILRRCAARGLRSAAERGEVDGEVARAVRERKAAAALADLSWKEYDREFDRVVP